ncbi:hypothetical protein G7054_g5259 [Neopestalotiopsis clavispora]|nr:hypothetical protein G7054_g5259 [Neopestalotiopsis clavispora]
MQEIIKGQGAEQGQEDSNKEGRLGERIQTIISQRDELQYNAQERCKELAKLRETIVEMEATVTELQQKLGAEATKLERSSKVNSGLREQELETRREIRRLFKILRALSPETFQKEVTKGLKSGFLNFLFDE